MIGWHQFGGTLRISLPISKLPLLIQFHSFFRRPSVFEFQQFGQLVRSRRLLLLFPTRPMPRAFVAAPEDRDTDFEVLLTAAAFTGPSRKHLERAIVIVVIVVIVDNAAVC